MEASNLSSNSQEVVADVGAIVKLVFDTWTPRPHFIVVQRQPKTNASCEELQACYELIGCFLRENQLYDREAILSFHRGKWYQKHTGKWHAHLCVPFEPYLEAAKSKITTIIDNKEWCKAKTIEDGMNNWHKRKMQEYETYKTDCIKQKISHETLAERCRLSQLDEHSTEFQLVWTYPAPRIGVIALTPNSSTLASLYNFMSGIVDNANAELSLCDLTFKDFGCHLCLHVIGQSGTFVTCREGKILTEEGVLRQDSRLVGYIQLDESQYLKWLPSAIKQKWLNKFANANHFVAT